MDQVHSFSSMNLTFASEAASIQIAANSKKEEEEINSLDPVEIAKNLPPFISSDHEINDFYKKNFDGIKAITNDEMRELFIRYVLVKRAGSSPSKLRSEVKVLAYHDACLALSSTVKGAVNFCFVRPNPNPEENEPVTMAIRLVEETPSLFLDILKLQAIGARDPLDYSLCKTVLYQYNKEVSFAAVAKYDKKLEEIDMKTRRSIIDSLKNEHS